MVTTRLRRVPALIARLALPAADRCSHRWQSPLAPSRRPCAVRVERRSHPRNAKGPAFFGRPGRSTIGRVESGFPSKKQKEMELAILNTPLYQDAREPLTGYVDRLQRAKSATDLRLLQRDLIFGSSARPPITSPKTSTRGRSSSRTSNASHPAATSTNSSRSAKTSNDLCSRAPPDGTSTTASSSTPTRLSSSTESWFWRACERLPIDERDVRGLSD